MNLLNLDGEWMELFGLFLVESQHYVETFWNAYILPNKMLIGLSFGLSELSIQFRISPNQLIYLHMFPMEELLPIPFGHCSSSLAILMQTGHWTYECKNAPVYQARPSRTKQLKNPEVGQPNSLSFANKPRVIKWFVQKSTSSRLISSANRECLLWSELTWAETWNMRLKGKTRS